MFIYLFIYLFFDDLKIFLLFLWRRTCGSACNCSCKKENIPQDETPNEAAHKKTVALLNGMNKKRFNDNHYK